MMVARLLRRENGAIEPIRLTDGARVEVVNRPRRVEARRQFAPGGQIGGDLDLHTFSRVAGDTQVGFARKVDRDHGDGRWGRWSYCERSIGARDSVVGKLAAWVSKGRHNS